MHREHRSQLEVQGLTATPLQTLEQLREWAQGVAFHDELVDADILGKFDQIARALMANDRRYTTVTESELADHLAVKRALLELDRASWYVANGHDPSLHIANAKKLLSQLNG
jgi:hypothetical protein